MKIFNSLSYILISPLVSILFGMIVATHNGIPIIVFTSNLIAAALGIPLALLIGTRIQSASFFYILSAILIGFGLMIFSLLSVSMDGIHRWISIGTYNLNISMIITPLFLWVINKLLREAKILSLMVTLSMLVLLIAQPDAGQTTAFATAALILFLFNSNTSSQFCLMATIILVLGITIAWFQPDSLPAAASVELILLLAIKMGVFGIVGTVLTIAILVAPILLTLKTQNYKTNKEDYIFALACIIYFFIQIIVTVFGNYPIPIIGAGAAPVIGWYIILSCTVVKSDWSRSNGAISLT